MKKLLTLTIISALFLSACGTDKYVLDNSDLPEENITKYEEVIDINLDLYKNAENDEEKIEASENLGFAYMAIKNYKKAILYYEEILETYPTHFAALNNIAVMHERVDEDMKALEYMQRLYEANPTHMEVISDTVRVLLKNEKKDDALSVLETFAVTEKGRSNPEFVSDQFELIRNS
jgi:tetratricopeptide (TPR) repeat protein